MVLRCTAKLLKLLGVSPRSLAELQPDPEDWYANLLYLDRRKCLLITQADTIFSVLAAGVRKSDLTPLGPWMVGLIERELRAEGLPNETFGRLDPSDLVLARTADRSVLGCMNDNAYMCRFEVERRGSLERTDIAELNQALRRNIHSAHNYERPIELAKRRAVTA